MKSGWTGIVKGLICAAGLALLAATSVPSSAQAGSGTVRAVITKGGFIVGVGGGQGTLTFKGRSYPLTFGGISAGAVIGASTTELVGRAYNLQSAADIAGIYTAVGAGAAVAGGAGAVQLQNSKGVVLVLQGRKIGLELSASLSGMNVQLR
ncbi:MAG: hypothetical protein HC900_05990 [Methylacidiphilales bacterium]|nr:hypothetical protein [Candidatus Methylacidiphilales bacterium]